MDDWVLLQKAPQYGITSEDAADVIQGRKDKIPYQASHSPYYSYAEEKDALGMLKLHASKGVFFRFLEKNAEGKREWVKSKNYFTYSHSSINRRFRVFCFISFGVAFFLLLWFINGFINKKDENIFNRNYQWKKKTHQKSIVKIIFFSGVSMGALFYGIYLLSLEGQLETGLVPRFQWQEPVLLIFGTVASAFLYVGLLTFLYWFRKQELFKTRVTLES